VSKVVAKRGYAPDRGDVITIDFHPQKGVEQDKRRPALVLSPVEYNKRVGLVVVCPITNRAKGYPWEVAIPDHVEVTGVVLADQVKSFDWRARKGEFVCKMDEEVLEDVIQKTIALLAPDDDDDGAKGE
jgi:mRNA interferase MazF